MFLGPKKSLLRYFLGGRRFVNIVMFSQHEGWADEGWTVPADPEEIRAAFKGWAPEAQRLVEAVCRSGPYRWGLFGRKPLAAWSFGRVSLSGDAAHPMLPFWATARTWPSRTALCWREPSPRRPTRRVLLLYTNAPASSVRPRPSPAPTSKVCVCTGTSSTRFPACLSVSVLARTEQS